MTRCLLESMSWFSPDMADMVYDQKGSWSETLRLTLSLKPCMGSLMGLGPGGLGSGVQELGFTL